MTDYWISGAKYWCEDCKKYISDNKASRKHHESGATHQTNRKKRLDDIKKKNFEQNKEEKDLDREFQRINKEAIHQHYQDLAQIANSDNNDPLPFYDPNVINSHHHTIPPPYVNPTGIDTKDWSYFDEEMIAAQKKRLYGNLENSNSKPPESQNIPSLEKVKETNGGDENNGEHNIDEPYDPDVQSDEEKKEKRINRETAGIAGAYKVVDPSTLYNQYYRLSNVPEITEEEQEEDQKPKPTKKKKMIGREEEEEDSENNNNNNNNDNTQKKRKKEISFDDEDNGDWLDSEEKSRNKVTLERKMEKSFYESLEEGDTPVVWKKPKLGSLSRGRRKK